MEKELNLTDIAALADEMAAALAEWSKRTARKAKEWDDWFARLSDATATLRIGVEAIGGQFSDPDGNGIAIALGGIRASSTRGLEGACSNWLTAARKKLEATDP